MTTTGQHVTTSVTSLIIRIWKGQDRQRTSRMSLSYFTCPESGWECWSLLAPSVCLSYTWVKSTGSLQLARLPWWLVGTCTEILMSSSIITITSSSHSVYSYIHILSAKSCPHIKSVQVIFNFESMNYSFVCPNVSISSWQLPGSVGN